MTFKITYKTGVSFISEAKTLGEAEKEAIQYAGYGFGSICITEGDSDSPNDLVAMKLESDYEWTEV